MQYHCECFVLCSLNNLVVEFCGTAPYLDAICPHRSDDFLTKHTFVVSEKFILSSEQPVNCAELLVY